MVANMNRGDVVLVKASRSEKFEDLAEMITKSWIQRSNEIADSE
jgi:UDP-N-acetylmuramoyl-tripeptide--D-alanyl-D-alanine ligase